MFDTLQDRLAATFKSLRGKGRLSEADIDATAREIRVALLEADVNLSVVKDFVARSSSGPARPRSPARSTRRSRSSRSSTTSWSPSSAARPGTSATPSARRRSSCSPACRAPARRPWPASWRSGSRSRATRRCWSPPTCSGRTRSTSCRWSASGPACTVFAPEPGNGRGRPGRGGSSLHRRGRAPALRRGHRRHRRPAGHRRRADAAGRRHPRRRATRTRCCSSSTR